MKRIVMILIIALVVIQANDSSITIEGDVHGGVNTGKGTINNNNFNVQLKLIKNRQYKTSFTKNITTIIQQDPKLLKEFQKQFNQIQQGNIRLESLNREQKKVLKVIQIKLENQDQLLKEQRTVLNSVLGTMQELKITTSYISDVTTDTNLKVSDIQNTVQEIKDAIMKPEVIIDIQYHNSNFCKDLNLRTINEIVVSPNLLFDNNIDIRREEEAKIYCLKELFIPYKNNHYKVKMTAKNQDIGNRVSDKISELNFSNKIAIWTDYQPSSHNIHFELTKTPY